MHIFPAGPFSWIIVSRLGQPTSGSRPGDRPGSEPGAISVSSDDGELTVVLHEPGGTASWEESRGIRITYTPAILVEV